MRKRVWTILIMVLLLCSLLPGTALAANATSCCWPVQGYHVVRYGETLYSIGRAYATQPYAIAAQNGIAYPYVLWVGRTLAIPVAPWVPTPPGPTAVRQFPVSPTPVPGCRAYHTVYYGQTLSGIAAWYGVNVWTLAAANHIYNLNLIYPGQVLCIP